MAEDLVATCYQRIGLSAATYSALAKQVDAAFHERLSSRSQELGELTTQRQRLEAESEKFLAGHFADAIDLDTLKRHQDRIRSGLAEIDLKLAADHEQYAGQRKYLASAMNLMTQCATMYRRSDDAAKRLANQEALFEKTSIGEDEQPVVELAEPFNALTPGMLSHAGGQSTTTTVRLEGFEPPTF
ncbi:hypothetical protein [Brachybacterium kimchii]|uniref:Uncharacterized protein n=1 Tax=Brachybacterium kimchii TaxID=2942909 RepID=A0ABY4N4R4_9MICO|nr:hypothetical protein [Brachybacterium kimchii]UQN29548.1 hypothetical protein M4486_18245 [Brachybacterium kimchii]